MSDSYIIVVFGILTGLAGLLSIWLVFGNFAFLIRAWWFLLGTLGIGCLMCAAIAELQAEWFVMAAFITGGVAVTCSLIRVLGFQIVRVEEDHDPPLEFQVFTWQLLGLVTIIAVLLGTIRWLNAAMDPLLIRFSLVLAGTFSVLAGVMVWGVFGRTGVAWRAAVMVVTTIATAVGVFMVMEEAELDPGHYWAGIAVAHAAVLFSVLEVFHKHGCRLTQVNRPGAAAG